MTWTFDKIATRTFRKGIYIMKLNPRAIYLRHATNTHLAYGYISSVKLIPRSKVRKWFQDIHNLFYNDAESS